ncbi:MAG: DUF5916 domain-containing protein [Candidatus Krumholzibacteriia bacterium]
MRLRRLFICTAAAIAVLSVTAERGSCAGSGQDSTAALKTVKAIRAVNGGIKVDGRLDESDWSRAPVCEGFIQQEPFDGRPATERTTVRVVYDDAYIYVGMKAYDSKPGKIVAHLTRRDDDSPSDWLYVAFDSYNDKRSGFVFGVNAAGTKQDIFFFNDTEEDGNWNAVWDVGTRIDADGWTAEFAIPFSQLRFANNCETHTWGFQAARVISRKTESSFLNPVPQKADQFVSLFGRIEGIERIPSPSRLEVLPYTVGSAESFADAGDDPFRNDTRWKGRAGGDLKYRLTTDVTADMTINPDFGQVEQDPSEVNLSAYESYFAEKRPFFMEGAGIFQYRLMFGDDNSERLFYSRRIGRSPQLSPLDSKRFTNTAGFYEDTPQYTTILGAAKITGKTASGVSIGILEAVTDKENATVEIPGGKRLGVAVEPMTNYTVARAQKDFNGGRTTLGGIVTNVTRDLEGGDFDGLMKTAVTGGVDFSHRWHNNEYFINGRVLGSYLEGSEEAVAAAQTSSARYFQRPDADYVEYDPTKTSLSGYGAVVDGGRTGGNHWNYMLGFRSRSPGFEVNDLGYMNAADDILGVAWVGCRIREPKGIVKRAGINMNLYSSYNYGGDQVGSGGNINGSVLYTNNWATYLGVERSVEYLGTGLTRGGPLTLIPGGYNSWFGMNTDDRKRLMVGLDGGYNRNDEGFAGYYGGPNVVLRPSGRFEVRLSSQYNRRNTDLQYVDTIDDTMGDHYVFAHLDMDIVSVTTRLNYCVTPEMSVQFYAMPFVAAGRYSNFREVVAPRTKEYGERFASYDYLAAADSPDFNFKEMRSNLVFRWEWSPGSTLYLVWSRGASDYEEKFGTFSAGRDFDRLFSTSGDNAFMIKISKWFSI